MSKESLIKKTGVSGPGANVSKRPVITRHGTSRAEKKAGSHVSRPGVGIFIALIRIYRFCISPFLGDCCRFYPSCSVYGRDAIDQHGVFKGLYFTLRRLIRCQPLHPGGYDPVPQKKKGTMTDGY